MKIFNTLLLAVFLLNIGFCQNISGYPYLKNNPNKVKPPASIEAALNQIDHALKNEIIEHFKNEQETIGTMRICQELGDFFICRWQMGIKIVNNNGGISGNSYSGLQESFFKYNVNNPEIMIRVVFICYHKKLNKIDYSFESEIEKIKKTFVPSDCDIYSWEQYESALSNLEIYEDAVLSKEEIPGYTKNDTLGRWYIETNRDSKFYITGFIDSIDIANQTIFLKIFDIVSDKRYRSVYYNNKLLKNSDILVINGDKNGDIQEWVKYNYSNFDYRDGTYKVFLPEWNDYIKLKFSANE